MSEKILFSENTSEKIIFPNLCIMMEQERKKKNSQANLILALSEI